MANIDPQNKDTPAPVSQPSDLATILAAIQGLEQSTNTQISQLLNRLGDLERDLAENSHDESNHGKTVPGLSATVTTTTITTASADFQSFLAGSIPSVVPSVVPPRQHFLTQTPVTQVAFGSSFVTNSKHPLSDHDSDCTSPKCPKKKKKKKKSRHSSSDSESSSESSDPEHKLVDEQMEELMKNYETSKPKYLEDPTTDEIPTPLAHLLETWFWSVYSKEEVKAELQKTLRPSNANALIPTKINEAVFWSLSPAAHQKDMNIRFIQNAFMKASQPFASVWATIISLENHLKAKGSDLQFVCDDLTIDFLQLRRNLDQGLWLLGIANSQMVIHRKEILAQFLHKDFKNLSKRHVPFDQWMFSSNLKGLLEDTIRVNRMVQQNKPTTSQVPKKGYGCRRGQHQQQRRGIFGGNFQHQCGRGFAKGWQFTNNIQQQQNAKKTGNLPKQQIQK